MSTRKKVAIFIDYTIRIPNFQQSYQAFKDMLFKDNFGVESDEKTANDEEFANPNIKAAVKDPVRFFWQNEVNNNPEALKFYMGKNPEKIKDSQVLGKYKDWFFNETHYKRFIEEYSYNVFTDCEVPSKYDLAIINTAQTALFDVYLFDRVENSRKVRNTLHFLAKNAVFVKSVNFIGPNEDFGADQFVGVWDPVTNPEQINKEKSQLFLQWFQKLEKEHKNK